MTTPEDRSTVRASALSAPVGAHLLQPDSTIINRPGWYQVTTPSMSSPNSNEVLWADLDAVDTDTQIDEVIAGYRAHGVPFKWAVYPWTKPADMADRLANRGLVSWGVRAMAAPTDLSIAVPAELATERVTATTIDLYINASATGWDLAEDESQLLRRVALERMGRGTTHLFIAWYDDNVAASAATLVKHDGTGYLTGANVLPAFRGRRVYRSLLDARMSALREQGARFATAHAREATSAPMLAHLGFDTVFTYRLFAGS